jgi:Tol biopolymer transport system component
VRTVVLAAIVAGLVAGPAHTQASFPEPTEVRPVFRDRDDAWSLAWSPDGHTIVFARRAWVQNPPHTDLWLVAPDGSGLRRLTGQVTGEHNLLPAWSPDGSRLAFQRTTRGRTQVWTMNADGSGARSLTSLGEAAGYPSWSPDGRLITFAVRENRNWDIYLMNADGSGVTRLTEDTEADLYPSFLKDGTKIIYDRRGQLRLLDVSTRESRVVTVGPNDSRPAVSFDGAYVVYRSRKTGDFLHLWLMRTADILEGMVPDTKAKQLTSGADISDTTPVFSPDGTRIAFVRQTRASGAWGPGGIWILTLR